MLIFSDKIGMVFALQLLFESVIGLIDGATLEAAMEVLIALTLESERSALI